MTVQYDTAGSFGQLGHYLEHGRGRGRVDDPSERVAWTDGRGLAETRGTGIAREMREAARRNERGIEAPVAHVILSWKRARPEEVAAGRSISDHPSAAAMRRAALRVLTDERVGLSGHQAWIVAHRDTDTPHVHLMIGRVHPETGRVWKGWRSVKDIAKVLRDLEREHGWSVPEAGKHLAENGYVPSPSKRAGHLHHWEQRRRETGLPPSFRETVRTVLKEPLAGAQSWREVEAALRVYGLALRRRSAGFVVTRGGDAYAKLSSVAPEGTGRRAWETSFERTWEAYKMDRFSKHREELRGRTADRIEDVPERLQEALAGRVSEALSESETVPEFIEAVERDGHTLADANERGGHVSGLSYWREGFKVKSSDLDRSWSWQRLQRDHGLDYDPKRDLPFIQERHGGPEAERTPVAREPAAREAFPPADASRWEELSAREFTPEKESPMPERHMKALEHAQAFYRENLQRLGEDHPARAYLRERGIGAEAQERFGIGYAPEAWRGLYHESEKAGGPRSESYREALRELGLTRKTYDGERTIDLLRSRITFPIRDAAGRTRGFAGRRVEGHEPEVSAGEHKYINTPSTEHFERGTLLYGMSEARAAIHGRGEALVVEGYTDVIAAHQHGFENAVGQMGTALKQEAGRQVAAAGAERAVVALDGDAGGRSASEESQRALMQAGVAAEAASLPPGTDPAALLRSEEGRERFAQATGRPEQRATWGARRVEAERDARENPEESPAVAQAEVRSETMEALTGMPQRIREQALEDMVAAKKREGFLTLREERRFREQIWNGLHDRGLPRPGVRTEPAARDLEADLERLREDVWGSPALRPEGASEQRTPERDAPSPERSAGELSEATLGRPSPRSAGASGGATEAQAAKARSGAPSAKTASRGHAKKDAPERGDPGGHPAAQLRRLGGLERRADWLRRRQDLLSGRSGQMTQRALRERQAGARRHFEEELSSVYADPTDARERFEALSRRWGYRKTLRATREAPEMLGALREGRERRWGRAKTEAIGRSGRGALALAAGQAALVGRERQEGDHRRNTERLPFLRARVAERFRHVYAEPEQARASFEEVRSRRSEQEARSSLAGAPERYGRLKGGVSPAAAQAEGRLAVAEMKEIGALEAEIQMHERFSKGFGERVRSEVQREFERLGGRGDAAEQLLGERVADVAAEQKDLQGQIESTEQAIAEMPARSELESRLPAPEREKRQPPSPSARRVAEDVERYAVGETQTAKESRAWGDERSDPSGATPGSENRTRHVGGAARTDDLDVPTGRLETQRRAAAGWRELPESKREEAVSRMGPAGRAAVAQEEAVRRGTPGRGAADPEHVAYKKQVHRRLEAGVTVGGELATGFGTKEMGEDPTEAARSAVRVARAMIRAAHEVRENRRRQELRDIRRGQYRGRRPRKVWRPKTLPEKETPAKETRPEEKQTAKQPREKARPAEHEGSERRGPEAETREQVRAGETSAAWERERAAGKQETRGPDAAAGEAAAPASPEVREATPEELHQWTAGHSDTVPGDDQSEKKRPASPHEDLRREGPPEDVLARAAEDIRADTRRYQKAQQLEEGVFDEAARSGEAKERWLRLKREGAPARQVQSARRAYQEAERTLAAANARLEAHGRPSEIAKRSARRLRSAEKTYGKGFLERVVRHSRTAGAGSKPLSKVTVRRSRSMLRKGRAALAKGSQALAAGRKAMEKVRGQERGGRGLG